MVNPTGYTALDLIGYTDKGTYSASATYVKNDLVHYSGNIWRVLIDDTTAVTPAEGNNYTLFIGEPSNLVEASIAPIEQTPSTTAYTVGRRLFYNDTLYEVIAAIAVGDNLVAYEDDPTNANIKVSAKVEEQIDSINSALTNEATTRANADTALGNRATALENDVADLTYGNAGAHNAIYRGKNLGTSVTAAQYTAISNGTFDGLYIGDYWVINSVNWRIAAFDYWYNTGDANCTTHHIVIVPDSNLASCAMNDTNITTGGYMGSDFYTGNNSNTGKATAVSAINSAFGSAHILSHREYLTNAVTDGHPSGEVWADSTVDLMNENMVYGSMIIAPMDNGSTVYANYTIDKSQLPLFQHDHSIICNRVGWWLRGIASSIQFTYVHAFGISGQNAASASLGVRPAFAIKA